MTEPQLAVGEGLFASRHDSEGEESHALAGSAIPDEIMEKCQGDMNINLNVAGKRLRLAQPKSLELSLKMQFLCLGDQTTNNETATPQKIQSSTTSRVLAQPI